MEIFQGKSCISKILFFLYIMNVKMTLGDDRFYQHILRVTFHIRLSYIEQPSDVSTVDLFV